MATHTLTLYAVLAAVFALALAFVAIWSRRELFMRLVALGLSLSVATVSWFAFSQLPGQPKDMSVEQFREKYHCATITPIAIVQNSGIFMLAKMEDVREPEYLFVYWNMRLASSLQKSMRVAKLNGVGSIVYGSASCGDEEENNGKGKGKKKNGKKGKPGMRQPGSSGQEQDGGDGFTFYPDPVPPMPEKNYGPLYEGPITMPERQ